MFYFKSVIINAVDSKTVELAIRQFAAKRFTFLDIHSSTNLTTRATDKASDTNA